MIQSEGMKESTLTRNIKSALEDEGAVVYKYYGNPYTGSGIPDLLICHRGRFIALEVKTERGKVSEQQEWQLKRIDKAGGIARVVRSVDEALDALRSHEAVA